MPFMMLDIKRQEMLYIKRCLKICDQNKGVPQGGVISPLPLYLASLIAV